MDNSTFINKQWGRETDNLVMALDTGFESLYFCMLS